MKRKGGLATKAKHQPESKPNLSENPENQQQNPVAHQQQNPISSISLSEAQRRKEIYAAELKKIELAEKQGALLRADLVRKAAFDVARKTRDAVLNVSDRIADQLLIMETALEIKKLLDHELKEALMTLTRETI